MSALGESRGELQVDPGNTTAGEGGQEQRQVLAARFRQWFHFSAVDCRQTQQPQAACAIAASQGGNNGNPGLAPSDPRACASQRAHIGSRARNLSMADRCSTTTMKTLRSASSGQRISRTPCHELPPAVKQQAPVAQGLC